MTQNSCGDALYAATRPSTALLALRAPAAEVLQLDIDNVVHPVTVEMVADAIDQARARGSAVLLVRLNTPGGLMSASREVVEALIASPLP